MEISIITLLGNMSYTCAVLHMPLGNNVIIRAVNLFSIDLPLCESDVLYIAKASDLSAASHQKLPANILCIKDIEVPAGLVDNSNLNLAVINENLDPLKVFHHVQEILLKYRRLSTDSAKLLNALIENKGLQHIVDIGYEILKTPIYITDVSHKVLAITRDVEVNDPFWKSLVQKGYVDYDLVSKTKSMGIFEKARSSKQPIIYNPEFTNFSAIFSDIFIDNKVVAHLTISGSERPLSEKDMEIASLLSKVISLEMQKSKFFRNSRGIMFEYFIVDLLDENVKDKSFFYERMRYLDWSPKANLHVLTIHTGRSHSENIPLIETRDKLNELVFDSKSVIYDDNIVMVISRNESNPLSGNELDNLIEMLESNKLYGGISRCFSSLINIADYYRQSIKAIELGLQSGSNKNLFYYEAYAIDHLFETCTAQQNITNFCHPSLFVLQEYDRENSSNLMDCLYTYLKCDKNLIDASSILHIHRNTLSYRINKIVEILDLDIYNKDISFHLLLSFKILRFKKAFQS